jgi:hypothetical protein
MNIGDAANAEKALGVALAQAPNYPIAHRAMAELYTKHLDDPEKAREHRERAKRARQDINWEKAMQRLEFTDPSREAMPTAQDVEALAAPWADADPTRVITVVSGLPRSGTSMMMQMLSAGGIAPFTDEKRIPDPDNPKGYLEHERATQLQADQSWVPEARGKVVKIVAQLLPFLPTNERYQIVFMKRDLHEVVASQKKMLERLGKSGAELDDERLMAALRSQIQSVLGWIATSGCVRFRQVDYAETIEDPRATAASLGEFLVQELDEGAMTGAVDPALRRQVRAER